MKKILLAALLLIPCTSFAADHNFKNRININVNGAYTDAMGDFEKDLKAADVDRTNMAFGISAGFGLFEFLEPGLEFQYFMKYDGTAQATNDKTEFTSYMGGIYLKAYLPEISISDNCGLNFYGKVGHGRYYGSAKVQSGTTGQREKEDADKGGFSYGAGFDFVWDHMFTGLDVRFHRVRKADFVSAIGINVGYRF